MGPSHDGSGQRAGGAEPRVEEVGDGLFAYLQPPGTWGLNNAGFIPAADGTFVIDTLLTERRMQAFLAEVDRRSPATRRTVLNTHYHGDHTNGNCLLPEATVIAHDRCRETMLREGLDSTRRFPSVDYGRITQRPAFVTFGDRLTVWADAVRIELIYVGGPAHTTGDVVCWVPDQRVLYAGDMAFADAQPFALAGSVSGFLARLEPLIALDPAVVVCGHGPIATVDVFHRMRRYLTWVLELARRGVAAGLEPLEVARDADLGDFADWSEGERLVANLHRAYADLTDEATVDAVRAYADMAALKGAPLHSPA